MLYFDFRNIIFILNKQIIKTKFGTHVYQIAIENSMKDLTISNIERQNVLNNCCFYVRVNI